MKSESDAFWRDLKRRGAQVGAGEPGELSMQQAERIMANAGEVPLAPGRLDEIVAEVTAAQGDHGRVVSGRARGRRLGWAAALLLAPLAAVGLGFFKMFDWGPGDVVHRSWDYPETLRVWLDPDTDESDRRLALNRTYSYVDQLGIHVFQSVRAEGGELGAEAAAALQRWQLLLEGPLPNRGPEVEPIVELAATLADASKPTAVRESALRILFDDIGDGIVALRYVAVEGSGLEQTRRDYLAEIRAAIR